MTRTPTYKAHLVGPDWAAKRADCLARAGYRCEQCGLPYGLTAHHRTYERLGHELPEDLVCLCRDCHRKIHAS